MAISEPTRLRPIYTAAVKADPIPDEICESDVFDQTRENVDNILAEQLQRYEEQTGDAVKVVILKNGQREFGLNSKEAAAKFANQIGAECSSNNSNQVIVVIGGRTNDTDTRTY